MLWLARPKAAVECVRFSRPQSVRGDETAPKKFRACKFLRPHPRHVAISNLDMKNSNHSANSEPTHEEITALAQKIYEEEGCPSGQAEAHWLEAERRLREQTGGEQETATPAAAPQREEVVPA